MNKRFASLIGFCLVLALSACSSTVHYDLDGTWAYRSEVTESTFEDVSVGEVWTGEFIIATTGDTVTFTDTDDLVGIEIVATRSGNTIRASYAETYSENSSDKIELEGTFLSPTTFSGTFRYPETFKGEAKHSVDKIIMTKQ